jgi:hypothetical protein
MNTNERLNEIRKNTPQEIKDGVDELVKAIDRAYQLGYHDAKQKLNIHGVMRPKPDCPHCNGSGGVQTGFEEYSTCPCVEGFGEPLGNSAAGKGVCDGCEDIAGFYLGTACPKCNRPFRQVK